MSTHVLDVLKVKDLTTCVFDAMKVNRQLGPFTMQKAVACILDVLKVKDLTTHVLDVMKVERQLRLLTLPKKAP